MKLDSTGRDFVHWDVIPPLRKYQVALVMHGKGEPVYFGVNEVETILRSKHDGQSCYGARVRDPRAGSIVRAPRAPGSMPAW